MSLINVENGRPDSISVRKPWEDSTAPRIYLERNSGIQLATYYPQEHPHIIGQAYKMNRVDYGLFIELYAQCPEAADILILLETDFHEKKPFTSIPVAQQILRYVSMLGKEADYITVLEDDTIFGQHGIVFRNIDAALRFLATCDEADLHKIGLKLSLNQLSSLISAFRNA